MAVSSDHGRGLDASTVGLLVAGCAAAIGLLWQRALGDASPLTDPAGVLGLLGGAAVAAATGIPSRRQPGGRHWARALVLALVVALVVGWWAVVAGPDSTSGRVASALVGATWLPPLLLVQLTASAAVRRRARTPRTHALLALGLVAALLHAGLLAATAGTGAPAPQWWVPGTRPWDDLLVAVGALVLLVLPAQLWRAALTSTSRERARLALAAVGATTAPLVVGFGLLLAVVRAPGGQVDAVGSVAFLVAVGTATAWGAWCASLSREEASRVLAVSVHAVAATAAALVVLAGGALVTSPAPGASPAVPVLVVLVVVVVGAGWLARRTARALLGVLVDRPPAPGRGPDGRAPSRTGVPGHGGRRTELLGLLADGASDAGIAARLVVSRRTVRAELRAVLADLDLTSSAGVRQRSDVARTSLAPRTAAD